MPGFNQCPLYSQQFDKNKAKDLNDESEITDYLNNRGQTNLIGDSSRKQVTVVLIKQS